MKCILLNMEQIAQVAQAVAQTYNPEGIAPFPFEKLINSIPNLSVFFADLTDDAASALSFKPEENRFSIYVHKEMPKPRQDFALALALGHFFLHPDLVKQLGIIVVKNRSADGQFMMVCSNTAQGEEIESSAYQFVFDLLMPEPLVQKAWDTFHSIQATAQLFKVPETIASQRLAQLHIIS